MKLCTTWIPVSLCILSALLISGCGQREQPIKSLNGPPIIVPGKSSNVTQESPGAVVKPAIYMLSIGERDIWTTQLFQPRQYCGADPQAYTTSVCKARVGHLYHVGVQEGNKCGYNYYVIICIN